MFDCKLHCDFTEVLRRITLFRLVQTMDTPAPVWRKIKLEKSCFHG